MICAALALCGDPAFAQQSKLAPERAPGWMAGCWIEQSGPKWTEECWMGSRGGVMLGAGRSGTGETLRNWEATQILPGADGKLAY